MRWFIDHLDDEMDADIAPMRIPLSGLSIADPTPVTLAKITHEDVPEGLAFMDVREMELGDGLSFSAVSVSPVILATKSGWRQNTSVTSMI